MPDSFIVGNYAHDPPLHEQNPNFQVNDFHCPTCAAVPSQLCNDDLEINFCEARKKIYNYAYDMWNQRGRPRWRLGVPRDVREQAEKAV